MLGAKLSHLAAVLIPLVVASPAWSAELIYRHQTAPDQARKDVAKAGVHSMVSMRDFHEGLSVYYYHTAKDMHRRQLQWLREFIEERLLANRAMSRNLTVDGLLSAELGPAPISGDAGLTPEKRQQLELEKERWESARRQYVEKLWQEARITIDLPEPQRPLVFSSESNTGPALGLYGVPVSIIEFCSFTSPECRAAWKTLRQVIQSYGQKLRIAHRDAPLPGDPVAMTAAVAARCAHRQGEFWRYQDLLYDNQDRLGDPGALKGFARSLGLDAMAFDRCLDKRETAQEIKWDRYEVRRLGLMELPSLFINGTYVSGALPLDELSRIIDSVAIQ